MSDVQLSPVPPALGRATAVRVRPQTVKYLGGVLALALAYYAAAKVGQALRYTASVSAIWPPAGVGIAALCLAGLRWWPGVLIGELVVNAELLVGSAPLPLGSLVGQQAGNMAEILVGAVLLRRLIGSDAHLDRPRQVGGIVGAVAAGTAISATAGTASMLAGHVIGEAQAPTFFRTWWLGDLAGGLVVVPAALTWARRPSVAWRRLRSWEGAVVIAAVAALSVVAVSTSEPATYVIFPALMWAAFRFGPPGATIAIAIATGVVVGVTAHELGPFFKQPIDHRTLSTQVYIVVMALTALFLSALVGERERSAAELADATRRESERAVEERHRIARDLHDSVSQALFSTLLETRTAEKALAREGSGASGEIARRLREIGALTSSAQSEMRSMILELGRDPVEGGLAAALVGHAAALGARHRLTIDVRLPNDRIALADATELQLFAIAREALANVVKHAGASTASVVLEQRGGRVVVEIRDDGGGFDVSARRPGHFGLESMRGRAAEIGGALTITSSPGHGTLVRVDAPASAPPDDEAR